MHTAYSRVPMLGGERDRQTQEHDFTARVYVKGFGSAVAFVLDDLPAEWQIDGRAGGGLGMIPGLLLLPGMGMPAY